MRSAFPSVESETPPYRQSVIDCVCRRWIRARSSVAMVAVSRSGFTGVEA
jgi:hypothetical protein